MPNYNNTHYNYLLDEVFLKELYQQKHRETYARLIALDFNENPLEKIEGKVTGGSINVDGTSAVRRTCNLTLVADTMNINDFYWGLSNKIKIEIGLKNTLSAKYSDIVWFPQGIFVITGFNTTYSTNSWQVSISGKDKMCFLNGDLGGNLPASIDFGKQEYKEYDEEDKTLITAITYEQNTIRTIVKEMIHAYGNEPYHNIIINDLDEVAAELIEYKGSADSPLYLIRGVDTGAFENYTLNGSTVVKIVGGKETTLEQIPNYDYHTDVTDVGSYKPTQIIFPDRGKTTFSNEENKLHYTVAKIEKDQVVGYRLTDLTYGGDLISTIGESITSILDKIVKMLGAYEYFYNIDGQFIFQRKKTYLQETWAPLKKEDGEQYGTNAAYEYKFSFDFRDASLISSFQNTPVLNNLKNDYSIWGNRESVNGVQLPIHYRYAIDTKPRIYCSFPRIKEFTTSDGNKIKIGDNISEQEFEFIRGTDKEADYYFKENENAQPGQRYTAIGEQYYYCTGNKKDLQIFEDYKETHKNKEKEAYLKALDDFTFSDMSPAGGTLEAPKKIYDSQGNFTYQFTPGWWNLRDWNEYYKKILNTTEDMPYNIAYYYHNSDDHPGYQKLTDLMDPTLKSHTWASYFYNFGFYSTEQYLWFISYSKQPNAITWDELFKFYGTRLHGDHGETSARRDIVTGGGVRCFSADIDYPAAESSLYINIPNFRRLDFEGRAASDMVENWSIRDYYIYNPMFPSINNVLKTFDDQVQEDYQAWVNHFESRSKVVDWRELIYQMAIDYFQHNQEDDFLMSVNKYNTLNGVQYFPNGYTGYEQYYTDMEGFWRQIYESDLEGYRKKIENSFAVKEKRLKEEPEKHAVQLANLDNEKELALNKYNEDGWAVTAETDPSTLNFWFDFMDDSGELGQFSVKSVGDRAKVVNDSSVTSIYFREVPDLLFVESREKFQQAQMKFESAFTSIPVYMQPTLTNLFSISGRGVSAQDKLNELLYQYSYCVENITLQTIPIYTLEPNTRIKVYDEKSKIDGEYIVTKYTIPLAYNGVMQITANKAPTLISAK